MNIKSPITSGIKQRFIITNMVMMFTLFVLITGGTVYLGVSRLSSQVHQQLLNYAEYSLKEIGLRFTYLGETVQNFTSSSLAINSLIDASGRSSYFPQAITEMSHIHDIADVIAFDFSGNIISSSQTPYPSWMTLELANNTMSKNKALLTYDQQSEVFIISSPINYHSSPQGGIALSINLQSMINKLSTDQHYSQSMFLGEKQITDNIPLDNMLTATVTPSDNYETLLSPFPITFSSSLPESVARTPIIASLREMAAIGLVGMIILIIASFRVGRVLAEPILIFSQKVKDGVHPCSPVGTNDELEILATEFDIKTQSLIDSKQLLEERIIQRTEELEEKTIKLDQQRRELVHSNKTLEFAHDKLKNLDKMKDSFISTVSHELRTPLTSLLGTLKILSSGVIDSDPEKKQSLLVIALSNGERLGNLINDILDFQKLASGKFELDLQAVSANIIINDAVNQNDGYGKQFNTTIIKIEPSNEFTIYADANRIRQILDNFISNAIKFSPQNSTVEVSAETNNSMIRLGVRDHGSGVPDEFRDSVFTPFAQADSSTIRKVAGTGLGLSICKSIAEAHHGNIGYDNLIDGGALFWIDIPTHT